MRATRANIYLKNLKGNIQAIQQHLEKNSKNKNRPAICFAVKADAYGHGAVRISKEAIKLGMEFLSVASVEEAIELRDNSITAPILLLSLASKEEIENIIKYQLIPLVADIDYIKLLNLEAKNMNKKVKVHIKVDTGMGRIGCKPEEALNIAKEIRDSKFLELDGICTHLPASDLKHKKFTNKEISLFKKTVQMIKENNINPGIVHCANSGAIIDFPDSYFDMVRPGIILYGYYPSKKQSQIPGIKPVMEFESKVAFVKEVKKGTPLSYNMTYKTKKDSLIATIPAGYGDGYNRLLSNKGQVLINKKLFKVAGRVCMDQFMINLGLKSEVKVGDKVMLFSTEAPAYTADKIADLTGTIAYEVCCNINKRVKRYYIN